MNNKPKESSKKLSDIVKEKFGGKRRSSKEPLEISLSDHDVIESDKGPDIAIAELDNVINSYHNKSSNSGGKVLKLLGLAPNFLNFCLEFKCLCSVLAHLSHFLPRFETYKLIFS